jgi:hypothetical protein
MQAGVDQKVLDDAELIALVRQTQDQFGIYGKALRVRKPSSEENQT